MSSYTSPATGHTGWKASLQKIGGNLAAMVIPNIGAFIAWGLLTALFIPTGWIPNENFAKMVGPMIVNLLPILIGLTGGRLVHGQRGSVIGAVATVGVIVGTDIPMFLGAMVMGPLAAWVLKKIDAVLEPKTPAGFEMLINNFSLGISGTVMAARPPTIIRRKMSPRRWTLRGSRSASAWARLDFPAAIAPVITMTRPRSVAGGGLRSRPGCSSEITQPLCVLRMNGG